MEHRLSAYKELETTFGFVRNLENASVAEIRSASDRLLDIYRCDLEDTLPQELVNSAAFLKDGKTDVKKSCTETSMARDLDHADQPEIQTYQTIAESDLFGTFQNFQTVLKLFLCLMVTNCSEERSFSTLKSIKISLRSTMTDYRLNMLCLMNIESQILRQIDFHDIIVDFARRKARTVQLI